MALSAISQIIYEVQLQTGWPLIIILALLGSALVCYLTNPSQAMRAVYKHGLFCWNCFLKPHSGDATRNQQDALESFYKAQASIYDSTRIRLLQGRGDLLGLVAAHIRHRVETGALHARPIWVDVGGGTGFNIEQMGQFVDVPTFFEAVYLVDLSSSLCRVAQDRFARLGWKNVSVICEDARRFRLDVYQGKQCFKSGQDDKAKLQASTKADVITMSYSLSMIPEFYTVLDSFSSTLSDNGVIGVSDFYVQSEVDYYSRNYIGGEINRHCMWISRVFWRAWFEVDRVNLDGARRDYLEYRFGTISSFNARCHMFGLRIPYYVWIGCSKDDGSSQQRLTKLNAAATESPFISAQDRQGLSSQSTDEPSNVEIRSKAFECAMVNLSASLPLPSTWYQSHHWRLHYDDQSEKHRQFRDEYIYAFTWEDARVDTRLLKIQEHDVVLAITSAGDNVLAYAIERPKRIHAIDLNPSQNHLLELKLAAFTVLPYSDVWRLFGEGVHPDFRHLLITKLSPHMSSLAFQFWLERGPKAFAPSSRGFYFTGCSRHALHLICWLFNLLGLTSELHKLCTAQTLAEQREIWHRSIRRVLLSKLLSWCVVSNKKWLWRALGVPPSQREMIEQDFLASSADEKPQGPNYQDSSTADADISTYGSGAAIWNYAIQTLDPVINNTLLSHTNHYYLLCLLGRYTPHCHPEYLSARAHAKLARPDAFDGLRIHTDEVAEVVERMTPDTLTIAVLMDSLDWFEPSQRGSDEVRRQVGLLHRALKAGGRVLLRSAGKLPWYVTAFEEAGFRAKRVAVRGPGACIDRVNMYASTWILTKSAAESPTVGRSPRSEAVTLETLSIGEAMQQ